ncbi:hypothetical protein [Microbispora sp. NBC_01389]|uniref:hypothetical protein n=1 Tax=Microbispora sp. NBC_01389 TaxID=2903584 RepID=UPI003248B7FE
MIQLDQLRHEMRAQAVALATSTTTMPAPSSPPASFAPRRDRNVPYAASADIQVP